MSGKAFFIDTTLCTACRGCQIACKQWNQLPATKTHNWGSMQNPKDLSFDTYKVVRFQEHMGSNNKPVWYFFPDQCRHCVEPPCMEASEDDAPGGIIIDSQTGAVLYTDKLKKMKAADVIESCPFNIPKAQKGTGYMSKCTMCVDRVHNGSCPHVSRPARPGHELWRQGQDGCPGKKRSRRGQVKVSQGHTDRS